MAPTHTIKCSSIDTMSNENKFDDIFEELSLFPYSRHIFYKVSNIERP